MVSAGEWNGVMEKRPSERVGGGPRAVGTVRLTQFAGVDREALMRL